MKIIGIDIGNTSTKIVLIELDSKTIEKQVVISTDKKANLNKYTQLIQETIKKLVQTEQKNFINAIKDVFLVSVVPELNNIFQNAIEKILNKKIIIFQPAMLEMANNDECGHDIIMLGVGAMNFYKSFIIVSFGTATVFITVQNQKPKSIIIAPGLELGKRSLVQNASLIQDFQGYHYDNDVFVLETKKAVSAGVILGQVGMIKYIIQKVQTKFLKPIPILITGGNIIHLKKELKLEYEYQFKPNLLFLGMISVYNIYQANLGKKISNLSEKTN